jgi:hypothetical protein
VHTVSATELADMLHSAMRHSPGDPRGLPSALAARVPQHRRAALVGQTVVRKLRRGQLRFLHILRVETVPYDDHSALQNSRMIDVWTALSANTAARAVTGVECSVDWNELRHYVRTTPDHEVSSHFRASTLRFDTVRNTMISTPQRPQPVLAPQFKCSQQTLREQTTRHGTVQRARRICVVTSVTPNSPAFHAGLTPGVRILTVNNQEVRQGERDTPASFTRSIMAASTDRQITLSVQHLKPADKLLLRKS